MVGNLRAATASAVAMLALASGWAMWARAQDRDAAPPASKTTTEKIKESASGAVNSVKKGVGSASEAIKNKYNAAKDHVKAMEIEARVYSRLHWDKALAGHKVELAAPKAGTIVLSGTVTDAKAKAKAVELARDTIGVTDVVDNLTFGPATVTEPATNP